MALRTSIIRGPAVVTYNSHQFYTKDDIKVEIGFDIFPIESSAFGIVQNRNKQRMAKITFTPVGSYALDLGAFWTPYNTTVPGQSLLGTASDVNLTINPLPSGTQYVFKNVAIAKLPDLNLSTIKTVAGQVEFICLGTQAAVGDEATLSNFYTTSTVTFADNGDFVVANILTQTYAASLGTSPSAPWDAIQTKSGWTISLDLDLKPIEVDNVGIVDWTIGNVKAIAKCEPMNVTDVNILALQTFGVARGAALTDQGTLTITGGTAGTIALYHTELRQVPLQYGYDTQRIGAIEFIATRGITSNVVGQLFNIS